MDPWLEHPSLWPDVHNSLIAAVRDVLAPQVAPGYYVALEQRTSLVLPDDLIFVGKPDVGIAARDGAARGPDESLAASAAAVLEARCRFTKKCAKPTSRSTK
jgi:hypothetical protein